MSEIRKGFVPLNEVESEIVALDGYFPEWLPQDRIGLNLRRVNRLCRLGGLRHLSITLLKDGETSRSSIIVAGASQKGEAAAGKVGVCEMVSTHIDKVEAWDTLTVLPGTRWIHGNISLNLEEMGQRIRHDQKQEVNLRSARVWAHFFDEALRQGVSKLGINNSLCYPHPKGWMMIALFQAFPYLNSLDKFSYNLDSFGVVSKFFTLNILMATMLGLQITRERLEGEHNLQYRWSCFPGPQLDRAGLLWFLTKTQPIVKEV